MSWPAKFPGDCAKCDQGIVIGQPIRWSQAVGEAAHVEHVECPPPPTPCPRCHLIPSASGGCGCDD